MNAIEFIKQVGENDKVWGCAEDLISFLWQV